jgi:hypothetical protein
VQDCGSLVLLLVATDEGGLAAVPLDRYSFGLLMGGAGCGPGELVGSRIRHGGGRIVSLDGEAPK